jgi:dCMP deaminase
MWNPTSWDLFYLQMAELISTRSKDPSTKAGAVIVSGANHIVSLGYNGFPQRMPDDKELYENREEKYSRIIHAEMNAVLFASLPLPQYCTLYTWPFMPCDRCVVCMIQSGIKRFVAPACPPDKAERWEEVFTKTRRYIKECGADLVEVK